jgi:predicted phosphodiesterase
MQGNEIAVIADVHGNAWALEAVLADIGRRGVKHIVNLGDNANGPLDPVRSVALLRASGSTHIRGNGDRMTGEGGPSARRSALFARERLDADALRWLRELPMQARGDGWAAFHAVPTNDETYFMENIAAGKTVLASPAEIAARLGDFDASLVLCGHTHLPRLVRLADGRTVLNPGSVGLPAYEDQTPAPHVIENGSPHARYAIARREGSEWSVEFCYVTYDWTAAAAAARAAGWTAWAHNLETGCC